MDYQHGCALGRDVPSYRNLAGVEDSDGRSQLEAGGQSELSADGGERQDDTLWLPAKLSTMDGGNGPGNSGDGADAEADSPRSLSIGDWRTLVSRYDWPVDEALRVIYGPTPTCPNGESGGDPRAYNDGNYGGMQINAVHVEKLYAVTGSRDLTLLFDPEVNVAVAYLVWRDSGGRTWLPWACRP